MLKVQAGGGFLKKKNDLCTMFSKRIFQKYGKWLGVLTPVVMLIGIWIYSSGSGEARTRRGAMLYAEHCASCHGNSGEGLRKLIPPVTGSDYVKENPEKLACIIKYGIRGPMTVNGHNYNGAMEGISRLEADEIRDIINYMRISWNGEKEEYSLKDVRSQLDACL